MRLNFEHIILSQLHTVLLKCWFCIMITIIWSGQIFSQSEIDDLNLDARRFISVYEIRKFKKRVPIWEWSMESNSQTRKIVDKRSIIRIEFNKQELSQAVGFKGNIYVEAVLIGKDGSENKAEVLPYTKIGEERTIIGVPARPSREIAQIFVNLLKESHNFIKDYHQLRNYDERLAEHSGQQHLRTPSQEELNATATNLKLLLDYIKFFKESGEEAEDAFLSLISLDYIALDKLEENLSLILQEQQESLKAVNFNPQGLIHVATAFDESVRDLEKLAHIHGTITGDLIYEIIKSQEFLSFTFNKPIDKIEDDIVNGLLVVDKVGIEYQGTFFRNEEFIDQIKTTLIHEVAIRANQRIFQDLDYATIDLLKEGAKDEDILYINLILVDRERRSSTGDLSLREKVYPVGRFKLKTTGWDLQVTDSFALIDRMDQHLAPVQTLSPSHFKGAPGVTLMSTLLNTGNPRNFLLNFLEPSFGLNVSYVDFHTNKDIEISSGVVIGLFNNKIFGTLGVNLNSTAENEVAPFYYGIGFSFAKLGDGLF